MNVVWAALVVVGVTALTVLAMLVTRRRAPEGSYFNDGDRPSGVFGVLATGFSLLLACGGVAAAPLDTYRVSAFIGANPNNIGGK